MFRLWKRLRALWASSRRTSGEPKSANGASSFHLVWEVPQVPLSEVAATLEVLDPPAVNRLYFWALQVSFATERRLQGGAHLGLQWNPRFPQDTCVNWGGYEPAERGSAILQGSDSELPSARKDPNTRDYPWKPGRRYRFRIARAPESPDGVRAWRGTVTDLETGEDTAVRDLFTGGTHLVSPMVWSEVFARCEQPSVTVRWSDLVAITADGEEVRPVRVRVNYQSKADGGCDNTTVGTDELGLLQITNVERRVQQGAIVQVPGALVER